MNMFGHERRNIKIFRRYMKTENDGADVTSDGSSFHRFPPKNGNASFPNMW